MKSRKKHTNYSIDQQLIGRNIRRVDNFVTLNKSISFECLIDNCGHIWLATPGNILCNHGCPSCAGCLPITNDVFDKRLGNRPLKRLEDINGVMNNIWFQCLIETCNYKWKTTPNSIINTKTGCIKCAGKLQLTNQDIDNK